MSSISSQESVTVGFLPIRLEIRNNQADHSARIGHVYRIQLVCNQTVVLSLWKHLIGGEVILPAKFDDPWVYFLDKALTSLRSSKLADMWDGEGFVTTIVEQLKSTMSFEQKGRLVTLVARPDANITSITPEEAVSEFTRALLSGATL